MARWAWNKGIHTTTFITPCLFCGKDFRSKRKSNTGTYTKYCSNKCAHDARSKERERFIECATCKKSFRTTIVHIKLGKRFCSRLCHYTNPEWLENQRVTRLGELGANWKGGITPIHRALRLSAKYLRWRKDVFERDDYTCQECGMRSGKNKTVYLNADHIKPFAIFTELRYEISNGRTLCYPCHREKTTEEQKVLWKNQYTLA